MLNDLGGGESDRIDQDLPKFSSSTDLLSSEKFNVQISEDLNLTCCYIGASALGVPLKIAWRTTWVADPRLSQ